MAAKIIAEIVALGSSVVARAITQAYRQAIINAGNSEPARRAVQNMAHRVSTGMTENEARLVLGVSENATWKEVMQRYNHLFEKNAVKGSFYIQSKVQRAKEALEAAGRHQVETR